MSSPLALEITFGRALAVSKGISCVWMWECVERDIKDIFKRGYFWACHLFYSLQSNRMQLEVVLYVC